MQTVITMTSHPARINVVAKSIYEFIKNQTVKPDIFYLWLSIEEFPNKEKDLPLELIKICNYFNIQLSWCELNEYCHKRWYVYPKHDDDIVISIDDDCIYPQNLVKESIELANNGPKNTIYNIFRDLTYLGIYTGIRFNEYINIVNNEPTIYKLFNGQSIFMPNTFPVESLQGENLNLRRKYCPICDESWILPFIKNKHIAIGSLNYNHIETSTASIARTWGVMSKKIFNSITVQDIQRYIVLRLFPEFMQSWKSIFTGYNTDEFDKYNIDYLVTLYNNAIGKK